MKGKVVFGITLTLLLILVQPAYSQPCNNVGFFQSTYFWYNTYGDYVPDIPLAWNYSSTYYEFWNWWDDTHETFDEPYMNFTTSIAFDSFWPTYNETGLTPEGTPYYIWNCTKVSVPEGNYWRIYGYPHAPISAPGFSLRRLYRPIVIREETSKLTVLAVVRVNQESDYLTIGTSWWETYEASPTLIIAVLKPLAQGAHAKQFARTEGGGSIY